MSDLEVQKRLWGRSGHGIPGANPNYAGRAGIGALVIAIILSVAFVTVTDHTPKMPATQYYEAYNAYVVNGNALQSGLRQVFHNSPGAGLASFEHELAGALLIEDRNLLSQQWPTGVERDVERFVAINQEQISVLNRYPSASASKRLSLLAKQIADVSRADSYNATIRIELYGYLYGR
jgi:hypothetical protein